MNKSMFLKSTFFPFSKSIFKDKLLKSNYINNDKIKELLHRKQKILKRRLFSRNKTDTTKFQTITKSNINKLAIKFNLIPRKISYKKEDKKNNTISQFISPYTQKNKNKNIYDTRRNYSAYYLKDDLLNKKKYISDLILNQSKSTTNKSQKISDIEKKISELEKNINLSKILPKSKTFYKSKISRNISKIINKRKNEDNKNEMPDEFKIKGTNIISPFCKKWRDKYLNDKLNKVIDKGGSLEHKRKIKKIMFDNKLNIIYAENEKMYKKKLNFLNNELSARGKKKRYKFFSPSEIQLKDREKRLNFIKNLFFFIEQKKFDAFQKKIKQKEKKFIKYEHMNKTCKEIRKVNIFEMRFK